MLCLKYSTIDIRWEIQNGYVMQIVPSKFGISYHGIFKTFLYWIYLFQILFIWIWNHSNRTKKKKEL